MQMEIVIKRNIEHIEGKEKIRTGNDHLGVEEREEMR